MTHDIDDLRKALRNRRDTANRALEDVKSITDMAREDYGEDIGDLVYDPMRRRFDIEEMR